MPKSSIPLQKITVDNQARFRYQDSYWIRLIDASICWAAADADTQFANFDSSASEKQLLIFDLRIDESSLASLNPEKITDIASRYGSRKINILGDLVRRLCQQGKGSSNVCGKNARNPLFNAGFVDIMFAKTAFCEFLQNLTHLFRD